MKTRHLACIATLALISACGKSSDAPVNKTREQLTAEAVDEASKPFSIGDAAENQMGPPPASDLSNTQGDIRP